MGVGLKATFKIPTNTIAGKMWNKSLKNRKTPKKDRKTPKKDQKTPHKHRKTPNKHRKTPISHRKSPTDDRKTPKKDRKSPKSVRRMTSVKRIAYKVCKRASLTVQKLKFWSMIGNCKTLHAFNPSKYRNLNSEQNLKSFRSFRYSPKIEILINTWKL